MVIRAVLGRALWVIWIKHEFTTESQRKPLLCASSLRGLRAAALYSGGTRQHDFRHFHRVTLVSFLPLRLDLPSRESSCQGANMDRRRNRRVEALLTVRIWGMDAKSKPFTQHAQVKNISDGGAVLQGMTRSMRAGGVLHIQHEDGQAQFRVVWVGRHGTRRQGEIGVEALASEPAIWDVDLLHCGQVAGIG